jgi:RNA polymerase sigma-70 factor (ECF subfamily)
MSDDPSKSTNSPSSPGPALAVVVPFERLLAEHAAAVRLYIRSLMPGYEGTDDLLQETMLKLWEKRSQYVAGTYFKAWAFQIARYLVMNRVRKLANSPVVFLDEELMDQIDHRWAEAEPAITDQHHTALAECLKQLKPDDRQLLHTRYATDVSLETYAEQEGTRPGTLKARLFRLRDALRDCIERRLASS